MTDLDVRLRELAGAIDVPPVPPGDDLERGRRLRRRRRWGTGGASALTAASVLAVALWTAGTPPRAEPVGPADRSGVPQPDTTRDVPVPTPTLARPAVAGAEAEVRDLMVTVLGLDDREPSGMSFQPGYDIQGRVEMIEPFATTTDISGRSQVVSARVARSWELTKWRDFSCHPGCATYDLDGRTVETGRFAGSLGFAHEKADGTVVVLELPRPLDELGIARSQVDAFLRGASLTDDVDVAAGWNDAMLDHALDAFMVGDDTLRTGPVGSGGSVHADSVRGTREAGEATWESELLATAPTGCPEEFARCERVEVDGVPLVLKHVEGGVEDGYVWVEHDGARVRSRIYLEPDGDAWSLPLPRVARFLADPFWQDLPASLSVTSR